MYKAPMVYGDGVKTLAGLTVNGAQHGLSLGRLHNLRV